MNLESVDNTSPQSFVHAVTLINLPEDVIRTVFSFLTDIDLYLNLRIVCRQLRRYVEAYIQLGEYCYCVLSTICKYQHYCIKIGTLCYNSIFKYRFMFRRKVSYYIRATVR